MSSRRLSIEELERLTDTTRRTIRYYAQRGLIPPSEGAGRGRYYEKKHVDALIAIKRHQRAGLPLLMVARILAGEIDTKGAARLMSKEAADRAAASRPGWGVWVRAAVGPGVEINIRQEGGFSLSPEDVEKTLQGTREILQRFIPNGGKK